MANLTFNVSLNGKHIDRVGHTFGRKQTRVEMEEAVKHGLVSHDGFDEAIRVRCVTPLTTIEYVIQSNYDQGWEDDTIEETRELGKSQLACYRENSQYPCRLISRRVSIFN